MAGALLRCAPAAALAAALAAAGCGGDGRTEAVDDYIGAVNAVQRDFATQVGQLNLAYRSFAADGDLEEIEPKLAAAERVLAGTRARLARLEPPEDARTLHELLLRLAERRQALAREIAAFARYQPALRRALAPLVRAEARLRARLRGAAGAAAQAGAFADFARAVERSREQLDALGPPAVLRSAHAAQAQRLTRLADVARELGANLGGGDRVRLESLLRRYARLIAQTDSAEQRRVRAAAVRSYNGRVRALDEIAAAIRAEQRRLERALSG